MNKLSIVIPVYYNQENILPLYEDIKAKIIDVIDTEYEIVFVDDGSEDKSFEVLMSLSRIDPNIKVIKLSRNFGSHAAILCGLINSSGDCAVVKAADLQEPTELILEMYDKWQQGNNVVLAVRSDRKEPLNQKLFSQFYYWLVRKFALPQMPKGGFDIFLLDRKVIEVLERMDELNSAITGQILWAGFKTSIVYYVRQARSIGKSRWTLKKKIKLVKDSLFSFSNLPIQIISTLGGATMIFSILWIFYILGVKIYRGINVSGWTTLIIVNLMTFGILMFTLGLLGEYVWRIYDSSRKRPTYIVEQSTEKTK